MNPARPGRFAAKATFLTSPGWELPQAEAIEAHRAFIARRRATRPSEEYRTPTEEEWDAFLAHFVLCTCQP